MTCPYISRCSFGVRYTFASGMTQLSGRELAMQRNVRQWQWSVSQSLPRPKLHQDRLAHTLSEPTSLFGWRSDIILLALVWTLFS